MIGEVSSATFKDVIAVMGKVGLPQETARKEISFAMQIINASKNLKECSSDSVLSAVSNVANIGLTLNPAAKEAFLIPRFTKQGKKAVLEPSYVGLIKLIVKAGSIKSILVNVVFKDDEFEINLADNINPVIHRPNLNKLRTKSGRVGVYAISTFHDGTKQVEWMDFDQIYAVRDCSESYKYWLANGSREDKKDGVIWITHEDEMSRKTVVKRLYKYLPRTGPNKQIYEAIDQAIEIDDREYGATFGQISYIENMLMSANISHERQTLIHQEYMSYSYEQAKKTIEYLKSNQIEGPRFTGGGNQATIDKAIKEAVENPKK